MVGDIKITSRNQNTFQKLQRIYLKFSCNINKAPIDTKLGKNTSNTNNLAFGKIFAYFGKTDSKLNACLILVTCAFILGGQVCAMLFKPMEENFIIIS